MKDKIVETAVLGATSYIAGKVFGPTLIAIGEDMASLYQRGRERIIRTASKKIPNIDDGNLVNLRAARDVIWNGAATEDEISSEYYGGLLASSRSIDGKDDDAISYIDTVNSLSSKQLELHYVIYSSLQRIFIKNEIKINVGQSTELSGFHLFFSGNELEERKLPYDRDLITLMRKGLVKSYTTDVIFSPDRTKAVVGVRIEPTIYGVVLFAAAHNKLKEWRSFNSTAFDPVENIKPIQHVALSKEELMIQTGLKITPK